MLRSALKLPSMALGVSRVYRAPFFLNQISSRRFISEEIKQVDKEAGEVNDAEQTGVINKTSRETMLYFDHVLPFRTSIWDVRQWLAYFLVPNKGLEQVTDYITKLANPKDENGIESIPGLQVAEVVPMARDGGAFVKFRMPPGWVAADLNLKIQQNTIRESSKGFINNLTQSTAFSVKGQPWIEDLRRFPNRTVVVKFSGGTLSEEELYSLFRRYGTIFDIVPGPDTATIYYRSYRGAICSKNCLNGLKVDKATLHIQYEKYDKRNFVKDMFVNHTRIAVPLAIALLTALAVIIFDPIREFAIASKITNKFSLDLSKGPFKWVSDLTNSTISSIHRLIGQHDRYDTFRRPLWSERMDKVKELKLWIEENINTFIIVKGPRGTGKHELVMQHALEDRKDVLYLDCDKLVKSRNDSIFISNMATQLGYFPVFPWLNSVSNLIDLGVQSLTGQKTGFSESKDAQCRNMLSSALVAIRSVSLRGYKQTIGTGENAISVKEEDYLQQHPEKKPVIVIDRYTTVNRSEGNQFVYKEIADWAGLLVSMNLAHVIFLTEDVGTLQSLTESLPDQVFKTLSLSDASKESAKSYVLNQLYEDNITDADTTEEKDLKELQLSKLSKEFPDIAAELDQSLEPIGGRMLDLQAFVRRVKSGESPKEALERMVSQTSEQITQMFLTRDQGVKNAQAWELIKLLTDKESIKYSEVQNRVLFKSNPESLLLDLERQGLISMSRDRGILDDIVPAKPIFRASFNNIVHDENLSRVLETAYLYKLIAFENEKIKKLENELEVYGYFTGQKEVRNRLSWIAGKIDVANNNVLNAEQEIKRLAATFKKK